tara:strand:- start:124 stop:507 length:384 start_codon:yes stop_codon:yes gene_type:complete
MSKDKDNQGPKDPKIIKGPWLDENQLTQEVINDLNRLDQEEKFKQQAQEQGLGQPQQAFEERVTVELIDYFQRSHKRKKELKALVDLNKIKAGMIEGLKVQEVKLKQIIVELEKRIKVLEKELENKK